MKSQEIDQQIYDLYDEYCHGKINRREFPEPELVAVTSPLGPAR